jgi:hypothetical protein
MLSTFACTMAMAAAPQASIDPLLDDLSRRAFRFFIEQSHPVTGLTLDRANNTKDLPRTEMVSSCAATGFALAAYAIGAERGWITREDGMRRARKTAKSLEEMPLRWKGWFYHWKDWENGKRLWRSEVSTIDTGILLCGLLMADAYFRDNEITLRTKRIMEAIDWKVMLTDGGAKPDSKTFTMGYRPEDGYIGARWDICNELKVLLIPALGSGKVTKEVWTAWKREPFTQNGREFLMSGPLFLHQMAHGFIDFAGKRDALGYDYWVAARNAVLDNRDYCIQNPKGFKDYSASIWGLSAADGKDGYRAWGAPPRLYEDDGTLAPSSTVACVQYIPELAIQSARAFKEKYPWLLGRYGFNISLNPAKDWHSHDVIGIDLGQMMLAIENHRDGFPHWATHSHPVIRKGMTMAGFRATHEGPLERRALKKSP